MKNIVSFSGGKDSTCLLLMMLERGMQVDDIIFCDTGVEFPQMYEHIKKVENYIGRKITILKADKSFEYFLLKQKKAKGNSQDILGYGFPRMHCRWCTEILKNAVIRRYYKSLEDDVKEFVGIAADEQERMKNKCYPLVEWGVTEADALKYCKEHGFDWGGLYDIFHRVSCWCCPLKSLDEVKKLMNNFPDLWEKLKGWEGKTLNNFRVDYTVPELEVKFKVEDEAISNGENPRSRAVQKRIRVALGREVEKQ